MPQDYWQPRFFVLQNGDLKTGLVGPFWNALLQTQQNPGETFRIRNFLQPNILLAARKFDSSTIQPALLTARSLIDSAGVTDEVLLTASQDLPAASAPDNATVDTTAGGTNIIAANTSRRMLVLTNLGTVTVYLSIGPIATNVPEVQKGIPLAANGGGYVFVGDELTKQAVNGITASGSAVVSIQEW